MPTKLSICVYVGDPVDSTKFRHTSIFCQFASGYSILLHIIGAHGFFQFEPKENYDPEHSRRLANLIPVASVSESVDPHSVVTLIKTTPIKNGIEDRDWNCQNWVGDALTRCVRYGYFTMEEREKAVDEMIATCIEAKDE